MSDQNNVNADDTGAQNNQKAQDSGNDPAKNEHMIPKSRFDQVVQQRKDAESALEEIANELVEEVPEDMRDIIPPELSPAAKIKWLRAAIKKGVFGDQATQDGPDSKRPSGKKPTDFEGMSPQAIMATGYKTTK